MGADTPTGRRALRGELVADTQGFRRRLRGSSAGGTWLCRSLHRARAWPSLPATPSACVGDERHLYHWEVPAGWARGQSGGSGYCVTLALRVDSPPPCGRHSSVSWRSSTVVLVDTGDGGLEQPLLLDVHRPRCGVACLPVQPCSAPAACSPQLFPHVRNL